MTPKSHSVMVVCPDCPSHWPAYVYVDARDGLALEPSTSRCPTCMGVPRLVLFEGDWRLA